MRFNYCSDSAVRAVSRAKPRKRRAILLRLAIYNRQRSSPPKRHCTVHPCMTPRRRTLRRYEKSVLIICSPTPRAIGVREPRSFASRATVVIAHTRQRRARKPLRDPIMGPRRLGCRSRSRVCIIVFYRPRPFITRRRLPEQKTPLKDSACAKAPAVHPLFATLHFHQKTVPTREVRRGADDAYNNRN